MKTAEINNQVCKPIRSIANEAKAIKCLEHMLEGGKVNRITLDQIGIAAKNDSAHTMISTLRNQKYIPIISERSEDGTGDYYMASEEIARYRDPVLRKQQREEMKAYVEKKRTQKTIERFFKFLNRVRNSVTLSRHVKSSLIPIKEIEREINALVESDQSQER